MFSSTSKRAQSSYGKKRHLDKLNTMTEGELKAMTLNLEDPSKEGTEQITKERLKQFNEINGFSDGPAL